MQTASWYPVFFQDLTSVMRKPQKENSILRDECNVRNICFVDNWHISPRFHCSRSRLHLNHYGTKKLQEKIFHKLAKLENWQFDAIGMYTLSKGSIRVRNKNKGKRTIKKSITGRALRNLSMNILT